MGIKVVSGDISFIVSQSGYEANDEDRQTWVHLYPTHYQMV